MREVNPCPCSITDVYHRISLLIHVQCLSTILASGHVRFSYESIWTLCVSACLRPGSEFHVLVLSRLTHRFEDYQNFGNITDSAQADSAADYLNALAPESVVLIADTEIQTFSSKLEYALQRCGAQLLGSESPDGPYGLIGIVRDADAEDTREALDEGWEEVTVELEVSLPHLYSPAPISRRGTESSQDGFVKQRKKWILIGVEHLILQKF